MSNSKRLHKHIKTENVEYSYHCHSVASSIAPSLDWPTKSKNHPWSLFLQCTLFIVNSQSVQLPDGFVLILHQRVNSKKGANDQKINYEVNNGRNLIKLTTHYLDPSQIQVFGTQPTPHHGQKCLYVLKVVFYSAYFSLSIPNLYSCQIVSRTNMLCPHTYIYRMKTSAEQNMKHIEV